MDSIRVAMRALALIPVFLVGVSHAHGGVAQEKGDEAAYAEGVAESSDPSSDGDGATVEPVRPTVPLFALDPMAEPWRFTEWRLEQSQQTERTAPVDASEPWWVTEGRACDGCPWRRPGHALIQTTVVNVIYGLANLARGQVTARVTPKTWWANLEHGWVWDLDDFAVNQIGHPYQGNNYFTSGRGNGLNYWESGLVTAFGSATWEFFGETNKASLNDFLNTTLGGIALGETLHRVAWLVRDPERGRDARWREIGATAIDPLTGLNRFTSGDANRVMGPPPEVAPSGLSGFVSAGVLWRGEDGRAVDASGQPFVDFDFNYGDLTSGAARRRSTRSSSASEWVAARASAGRSSAVAWPVGPSGAPS